MITDTQPHRHAFRDEQVARLKTKLLHPEHVVIMAVGPATELEPQLARLGSVGVVSP